EALADVQAEKALGGHADDRDGQLLEGDRASDDVGGTGELPLPESVADDRDRSVRTTTSAVIDRCERAAENGPHAKRVEVVTRCPHGFDERGLTGSAQAEAIEGGPRKRARQRRAITKCAPDGIADCGGPVRLLAVDHHGELVRIRDPQRLEKES